MVQNTLTNALAFLAILFLAACGPNITEMDETDPGALISAMAPYVPDYEGRTDTAIRNNVKVIEQVTDLIHNGAKVNFTVSSNGYTPLHVATLYNEPKLVELLLNNGANPTARTTIGDKMTPLELANKAQRKTGKDYSDVIRLLTP